MKTILKKSKHITSNNKPTLSKKSKDTFFTVNNSNNVPKRPFFSPFTVQPNLIVGKNNDKHEQGAEAVADKVIQKINNPQLDSFTKENANSAEVKQDYKRREKRRPFILNLFCKGKRTVIFMIRAITWKTA